MVCEWRHSGERLDQNLEVWGMGHIYVVQKEGGTFIYDPDSKRCAYEMHNNSIGRNMEELLRKLRAAVFVRENG